MLSPTASDVRVFVPAKDFSISKAFYKALGWKLNWEDAELAEMEIADRRFFRCPCLSSSRPLPVSQ